MRFELGKYYRHTSGAWVHIIGMVHSETWGWCLVGEDPSGALRPVGMGADHALHWEERDQRAWAEWCKTCGDSSAVQDAV